MSCIYSAFSHYIQWKSYSSYIGLHVKQCKKDANKWHIHEPEGCNRWETWKITLFMHRQYWSRQKCMSLRLFHGADGYGHWYWHNGQKVRLVNSQNKYIRAEEEKNRRKSWRTPEGQREMLEWEKWSYCRNSRNQNRSAIDWIWFKCHNHWRH